MAKESTVPKAPVHAASGDNMKFILGAIVIVLVLAGAYYIFSNNSQSAVTTVTCNRPYILVGSSCCLDTNNNRVCDSEELTGPLSPEQRTTQPPETSSLVLDCSNAAQRLPGEWVNPAQGMRLSIGGNAYTFTVANRTYSGDYVLDFGNYLHLRENSQTVWEFRVCYKGDYLQLLGDGGAEYPLLAKAN